LRQNIDRSKAFTYIDTDKTGNYDPAQEAKLKAARLQKAKAAKSAKKKGKSKAKAKEKAELVMKCILVLRFEAYGNVRNVINDEDNWQKIGLTSKVEMKKRGGISAISTDAEHPTSISRALSRTLEALLTILPDILQLVAASGAASSATTVQWWRAVRLPATSARTRRRRIVHPYSNLL
jgi:hypothetical protein